MRKQIAISFLPFLTCNHRLRLERYISSHEDLLQCSRKDVEYLSGCTIPPGVYQGKEARRWWEAAEQNMDRWNVEALHISDGAYPHSLRSIYDPPYLLFCRGTMPDFQEPSISVFGGSSPSPDGILAAEKAGRDIGQTGILLAAAYLGGIPHHALTGCLKSSGQGIAVLQQGCAGDEVCSPLLDHGGTVICEHLFGCSNSLSFLRIAAGLTPAVWMIEAPSGGMTDLMAACSLDEGRDIYVHPGGMQRRKGKGGKRLAEEGADVLSSICELIHSGSYIQDSAQSSPGCLDQPGCAEGSFDKICRN